MNTDSELLRRYLAEKSEPAFTELVQRYIGLVYSVAVRRVGGDAQLAEDVTQTVFNDLARKASTLRDRVTLGGWLYLSANVASAAVVRSERRRKVREIAAHDMQTTLSSSADEAAPDWTQLRSVIDGAIVELKEQDREAVVLRFFEQRSFAEVGTTLCVTEEAARKRVDRALEKLRAKLERRGVFSTAAALGLALATIAPTSAPAALAAKIATHAFASTGAGAASSTFGSLAIGVLPAAAIAVLGGIFIFTQRQTNGHLRAELSRLAAPHDSVAALQTEIQRLTRNLAEVDALRQALARPIEFSPARAPAPAAPRAIAAQITVAEAGTIMFNQDFVSLAEFIYRVQQVSAKADPEMRLHVSARGASMGAVAYIIEEARKAGIRHLTVEGDAKPDPKFNSGWF